MAINNHIMLLESHLQLAIRAHNGTSHVPEQRGKHYIKGFSEELAADMERVTALGGDAQAYRERYERHFTAWLHAKSNCLSSMITGPSGFPVRRAEKANRSEQNRFQEFQDFRTRYFARMERDQRRADRAASDPVAEMRHKIAVAERSQEAWKAANKIIGMKKLSAAEKIERLAAELAGLSLSAARAGQAPLFGPDLTQHTRSKAPKRRALKQAPAVPADPVCDASAAPNPAP